MTFRVTGPTPGLCIHTRHGQMCTRYIGHDGEHLMVDDGQERLLATFERFPVHQNGSK